jgi:hypothetical protein
MEQEATSRRILSQETSPGTTMTLSRLFLCCEYAKPLFYTLNRDVRINKKI